MALCVCLLQTVVGKHWSTRRDQLAVSSMSRTNVVSEGNASLMLGKQQRMEQKKEAAVV